MICEPVETFARLARSGGLCAGLQIINHQSSIINAYALSR
jgi:hypothetical protein